MLFRTGGAGFGEVVTAEQVAVEVLRTLCGSVGLITAVPLTTLLAAALATQEAEGADQPDRHRPGKPIEPPAPRMPYSPRRGLTWDRFGLLFEQALVLHQPALSHAAVGNSGWPSP